MVFQEAYDRLMSVKDNVLSMIDAYNKEGYFGMRILTRQAILEGVDNYARIKGEMVYDELSRERDPMKAAIKMISYPVICVRETEDTPGKLRLATCDEGIDLLALSDAIRDRERQQVAGFIKDNMDTIEAELYRNIIELITGHSVKIGNMVFHLDIASDEIFARIADGIGAASGHEWYVGKIVEGMKVQFDKEPVCVV